MLRKVLITLLLLCAVPLVAYAQSGQIVVVTPPVNANPNLNISYPPSVYVVRGIVDVRGSASVPGMASYVLEFLNLDSAPDLEEAELWFPVEGAKRAPVTDGILGRWDTRITEDGLYALRLRVIAGSGTQSFIVSPIRVENQVPEFVAVELTATAQAGSIVVNPPTPTLNIITRPTLAATPTPFSNIPQVTALTDANVRRGDSVAYEVVGSLLAGDNAQLIGQGPSGWYYIQLSNGRRGYIAPFLVSASGNTAGLPIIAPPATPTPTFTATPQPAGNLTINGDNVRGSGGEDISREPRCNVPFKLWVNVTNLGTQRTPLPAIVTFQIFDNDSNTLITTLNTTVPQLNPGENFIATVDVLLGPSQFPRRDHRVVATVDSNNAIPEENENDNTRTFTYRMRGGDCP